VKFAILAGAALLVLVTLATSFPLVVAAQSRMEDRSANMEDHLIFTRELAQQGAKLETLAQQHQTMIQVPERLARVEERLDNLVKMVYATLGGVFALLLKELWVAMTALRSRRSETEEDV
jgi:hypothetical protein